MRFLALFGILCVAVCAATPGSTLLAELKAKRESLSSLHQEFEVTQTYKSGTTSQSSKRQVVLDMSHKQWRERSVSGSGDHIKIFDGKDLFLMEEGGAEFVRTKRRAKEEDPAPSPYAPGEPEWAKAAEVERKPCGIPGSDHLCVVLDVPLKRWTRTTTPSNSSSMLDGSARMVLDIETGLLIAVRTVQVIENAKSGRYQSDVTFALKRMGYGTTADARLFQLPSSEMQEVKELPEWNSAKIKKQLAGKAAPDLVATDIQGKPVTLSAFKGKTVLLDFFTTWCPPCRADGPALDKLYRKYGEQDLMIVGISVSEERAIVEKFLKEHPHTFPILLTTENEMPRPFQIGTFPTYIVINKDGTVAAAVQGDQGFADLLKLLKKAGLDID